MQFPRLLPIASLILVAVAACSPSTGSTPGVNPPAAGTPAVGTPAAGTPAATSPSSTGVTAEVIAIDVLDFKLDPSTVNAVAGTVSLAVTNGGPTVHNVKIRDAAGATIVGTKDLREGESETVSTPLAAGTYVLFCSLPGHESLGIKGTLMVTGS